MKNQLKNIQILFVFLFGTILFAQEQLRVEYEMIPHYNPADNSAKNMIMLNSYYELFINKNESSYNYLEKVNNEQPKEGGTMTIQMGGKGTIYKNTAENMYLEETFLGSNSYLIQDSLTLFDWKITKDSDNVLGFEVRKATLDLDDEHKTKVTAWYAPKLNFKNGPGLFWGLPGLILKLESGFDYEDGGNEGFVYEAKKVEVLDDKVEIKKPSKGKKVNSQEFAEIIDEYYEKMNEMYSDGVDKD